MRNERLVRLVGPDERPLVDTYHNRVRETILGGLDEQSRKSIHKTLAEIIEADAGAASEELQAGLESWRRAGEGDEKPIGAFTILPITSTAAGEARTKAWIYAILFKQGFLDRSCALYANGLRRLGHWVPRSSLGFGFGVFGELVIQFVHGLRRGSLHRKAPSSRLDLAGLFLTRLSAAYAFQNSLKLLWAQFCGMNRGELVPPSSQLAFTYAGHSCVMSMLGWRARGARYGDLSIEIARSSMTCGCRLRPSTTKESAFTHRHKSFCVNSHTILSLPNLVGALRRHAEALESRDSHQSDRLRRRAHRLAAWATRITYLFPAAYPVALRERSLVLAAAGRTKQALKFANKSCAVALSQKARYEHAQSSLVRGTIARRTRSTGGGRADPGGGNGGSAKSSDRFEPRRKAGHVNVRFEQRPRI